MASLLELASNNIGLSSLILSCFGLTWLYYRRSSTLVNVPGPRPSSLLTGNLLDVVAPATGRDWLLNVSNLYGGVAKLGTLFGGHSLLVHDPRALHQVLVKDQDIFEEWSAWTTTNSLLFGPGLLATVGSQHKKQRKMLGPAFSVKHLRVMTPMFVSIARELESHLSSIAQSTPQEVDVIGWLTRFALEAIGRGGMGRSFGNMSQSTIFSEAAKQLTATLSVMSPGATLTPYFKYLGPAQFRRFLLKSIPWSLLQRLVEIVDIMDDEAKKILAEQQKDLGRHEKDNDTKDIIRILLRANQASSEEERMTEDELVAQISILVFTAMDTTSTAIARVLHLLALNPDVQERLRAEVVEAYHHNDDAIDFNNLSALPYLDAIIKETLRVYPPIPMMFRQTLKDAVLPLLHPITGENGQILNEVHVEKGTDIVVNIIGANHNPKTWGPDASEWKPDRWLAELPESVTKIHDLSGVFAHQMTFIAGNRSCIGFNFAQLEMRVVLAILIQTLEFSVPKDKSIAWNSGLLMTPVIEGDSSIHTQMPLIVKRRNL
ncbi:Cytochrome P450 monooxygenase 81 [Psilocybe cubensis]|uniref:Cytochrome P450 monooxygenase 81 n=2 Tax=Psilocybe cubensis TaxID=181762 RepID=A0ACB8GS69_PSICU|nr:Cytochrome P450 monooxygenase 81 [Psilocybe cubensis]KAH9478197.1 Cytochrome P450 monooxygenase 81 [Psilocybe cubensis]